LSYRETCTGFDYLSPGGKNEKERGGLFTRIIICLVKPEDRGLTESGPRMFKK
jgi:hypothetical protein